MEESRIVPNAESVATWMTYVSAEDPVQEKAGRESLTDPDEGDERVAAARVSMRSVLFADVDWLPAVSRATTRHR